MLSLVGAGIRRRLVEGVGLVFSERSAFLWNIKGPFVTALRMLRAWSEVQSISGKLLIPH